MKLIYILELENNKFYVGKTSKIEKRFNDHINGQGSEFTKIYKPIQIYKIYKELSEFDEDNYTKKYMKLFGIDNVRGGTYCNVVLSKHQIDLLNKELCTTNNTCYRCGRDTHYANNCYANTHINGTILSNKIENNIYSKVNNSINYNSLITQFKSLSINDTIYNNINDTFSNTVSVVKSIYRYFKY